VIDDALSFQNITGKSVYIPFRDPTLVGSQTHKSSQKIIKTTSNLPRCSMSKGTGIGFLYVRPSSSPIMGPKYVLLRGERKCWRMRLAFTDPPSHTLLVTNKSHRWSAEGFRDEKGIPAGRPGRNQDMAQAILHLAANQYANVQVLALDGGFLMTHP